ncbi:hypothetical protein DKK76_02910 [Frischella perrara]|uniref:Uncharacterized protein n=1 Tax=Frischella perrara TaxID=1267021 RepID=A0A318MSY6_FRIPE|nr:hypothetical protein [Frischella perrara]PXY95858.1 hypothetical protein DKK76_02910 [Frischella perrara]
MSNWENFITTVTGTTVPNNPDEQSRVLTCAKDGYKKLDWLRICRIPLRVSIRDITIFGSDSGDFPGHYWVEIIHGDENNIDAHIQKARSAKQTEKEIIKLGNVKSANGFRESYGWYPTNFPIKITIEQTAYSYATVEATGIKKIEFFKQEGIVNGASNSRIGEDANEYHDHTTKREAGRKTMYNNLSKYAFDPHQYQRFKEEDINMISNPYLPPGDTRTKETIIQQIRDFASTFHSRHSAIWSWYNDSYDEVNCHTFLFLLLGKLGLADVIIRDNKDTHFTKYLAALEKSKKADKTRKDLLTNLKNLSLKIPRGYY